MDERSVRTLIDRSILRAALKTRNVTQGSIANRIGIKQSTLSVTMRCSRISLAAFAKILSALDYDVVIADRETGDVVWKLETERPIIDDDI